MIAILSPNRLVELTLALDADGAPVVAVRFRGRDVLRPSRLGVALGGAHSPPTGGFEWLGDAERTVDSEWSTVYGERSVIADRFHENTVRLRGRDGQVLDLILRCYDGGAAWRCRLPERSGGAATYSFDERPEFRFPEGTEGYCEVSAQGGYVRLPLNRFPPVVDCPLTLVYPHGKMASLFEAGNAAWPRLRLAQGEDGLRSVPVATDGLGVPPETPWRVLAVADRPCDLPLRSDLLLNLSEFCALEDTTWIRPGKAIHVDEQTITGASFEHQQVLEFAAERGIGVWLDVEGKALEGKAEELLSLYASLGLSGIRVDADAGRRTSWFHELVRTAARYRLMVAFQGGDHPLGYSRTYPNVLTQSGAPGDGILPTAAWNCTLPFTRGPGQAYDSSGGIACERSLTTRSHQLALAVVHYGPLALVGGITCPRWTAPGPDQALWRGIPTVWDETVFLTGEIGEFVVVARRSGAMWYVGAITNAEVCEPTLRFPFLEPGRTYRFHLCRDAQRGEGGEIVVERGILDAAARLRVALAAHGGCTLRLAPA